MGIRFSQEPELIVRFSNAGNNGSWMCVGQAIETPGYFIFYSVFPTAIPVNKRQTIIEFVHRANYGLRAYPKNGYKIEVT